jgi:multidrug efflux pump subunit AcrB
LNLAALAIDKRTVTYFVVLLLAVGGFGSYFSLGQLEDPEFTVKTALISTAYPGASPEEVELEVTDVLEKAIQEMPQLKQIYSTSSAGQSNISVDVKSEFWSDRLPQVWDELRNKISDAQTLLPPGAGSSAVSDDFSLVYGFLLAITGDGFDSNQLDSYIDHIRKELAVVPGVARVEEWGSPEKVVYVEISQMRLAALGLTPEHVSSTLQQQNMVVDAGSLDVQNRRFRIAPTGVFTSPEAIGELVIASTRREAAQAYDRSGAPVGELVRIRDVATVLPGIQDPPSWEMRFDGRRAQGLALSNVSGGNVVETGRAIDRRLAELIAELPRGIEIERIAWQSDEVSASVNGFLVNLGQAVAIVLLVLTIPMGWRMGVIIGSGLLLTILGTFMVMAVLHVDLQRMSLGALVISLGMMVDNSIVVADGFAVRLQRGMNRRQAAIESAQVPSWPLLGATLVAVMAFYPVFASTADAGEYCRTLFSVVAISLFLSWLIAVTVTPLQCMEMLPAPKDGGVDPYASPFYDRFRALLGSAIRYRFLFLGAMAALLAVSLFGFRWVPQMFFPESSRPQLMIDYWGPEGTRIQTVSAALRDIEEKLLDSEHVAHVATFVGQGPPRFYLPVDPEGRNPSYGQLIVNTPTLDDVNAVIAEIEPWLVENVPEALVRVRKYGVGPSETWPFEARFTGPAEADLGTLRRLGSEGLTLLRGNPLAKDIRTDMREQVLRIVPDYDQTNGRWANISRSEIAQTTKRSFDGLPVGLYREGRDLYPILLRHEAAERRAAAANIDLLQIQAASSTKVIPLSAVTTEIRAEWEDPIIVRWNRRRAVTAQGAAEGVTFPTLRESVVEAFDAIPLPPGYELIWDGEHASTVEGQAGLLPGIVPAVVIMLFIIVALFNAIRPALIIIFTSPFMFIGITTGLLVAQAAFGFVALLGAMSLSGMMIKNSIVLLDQVGVELEEGKAPYQAVIDAAVSRLRPVLLAAATTVLGVIPLLKDLFWVSMSVTIMAGLAFGTVLVMVLVPVLYATLFGLRAPGSTS